jgi:hypothetical protein
MIDSINYYLTNQQIDSIIAIVDNNSHIIKPHLIYNINKPASHLVYYIKELYEYVVSLSSCDLRMIYEYRRLVDEKKFYEKFKK